MAVTVRRFGPAVAPACRRPRALVRAAGGRLARDSGAQALEFALVLPALFLVLGLVLHAGLVGMDLVHAQGLAREAARAAAVGDDASARAVAARAAGERSVQVTLAPTDGARRPGDLVTATVELESGAFARFGVTVRLPASATMRVEDR